MKRTEPVHPLISQLQPHDNPGTEGIFRGRNRGVDRPSVLIKVKEPTSDYQRVCCRGSSYSIAVLLEGTGDRVRDELGKKNIRMTFTKFQEAEALPFLPPSCLKLFESISFFFPFMHC